jgi:hypothetical protein
MRGGKARCVWVPAHLQLGPATGQGLDLDHHAGHPRVQGRLLQAIAQCWQRHCARKATLRLLGNGTTQLQHQG